MRPFCMLLTLPASVGMKLSINTLLMKFIDIDMSQWLWRTKDRDHVTEECRFQQANYPKRREGLRSVRPLACPRGNWLDLDGPRLVTLL